LGGLEDPERPVDGIVVQVVDAHPLTLRCTVDDGLPRKNCVVQDLLLRIKNFLGALKGDLFQVATVSRTLLYTTVATTSIVRKPEGRVG
jgi:hypothetical protein